MSKTTLSKMAHGGLRDHLGGGFHRYSVDAFWHIPHYEKMLYDQAQLTVAYLEGYQNTGSVFYANIARGTLEYCFRELSHPEGSFYSAEDADSYHTPESTEKSEGAFYIWKAAEIDELLGKQEGSIFRYAYGARRDGNARPESDPQGELSGYNTLFRAYTMKKTGEYFKLEASAVEDILERGRKTLLEVRGKRPHPHLDDKVLTAWNGMMISALCKAANVLGDENYLNRARQCAEFIHKHLSDNGTKLRRSWREGVSNVPAFAPDYALLIQGLLDLYEASFDLRWARWAEALQEEFDASYGDAELGGYFSVSHTIPNSILKVKEDYDGAEPSPNSIASMNLLRLANLHASEAYRTRAEKTLKLFGQSMEKSPLTVPAMISALDFSQHGDMEIVLAGDKEDAGFKALAAEVHKAYLPHAVIIHADQGEGQAYFSRHNQALAAMKPVAGKAAAYVCRNRVCQAPVTSVEQLKKLLGNNIENDDGSAA